MARLLTLIFLFQLSLLSHGQDSNGLSISDGLFKPDPVESAPASFVLDKARLFNEREAAQLSARLKEFATQHEVPIYVVAYSVMPGETIDERASRLKTEWLDGKPGVLVVYLRGTEQLTFSAEADGKNFLERFKLQSLFQSAYEAAAPLDRGSSRLIAASESIMRDLPPALDFQRRSIDAGSTDKRQFVGWSLAVLAVVAALGMFAFQFLRRAQVRVTKSYEFPSVKVTERYGAAYSGGHQAEIQF